MLLAIQVSGANLATLGSAILGVNDAIDGDAGTPRVHVGVLEHVNDGDPGTRVDTWYGGDEQVYSYVGVVWPQTRFEIIQTLSLTLATFSDGGWFGTSGLIPPPMNTGVFIKS
jgi:hypothetical protein